MPENKESLSLTSSSANEAVYPTPPSTPNKKVRIATSSSETAEESREETEAQTTIVGEAPKVKINLKSGKAITDAEAAAQSVLIRPIHQASGVEKHEWNSTIS